MPHRPHSPILRPCAGRLVRNEARRTLIGNLGYDPTYGARRLKRVIQKRLIDKLALKLLEGEFQPGDRVVVDAGDGDLTFQKAPAIPEPAAAV